MVPETHAVDLVPDAHGTLVELDARALHDGVDPGVRVVDADVQLAVLLPLDAVKESLDVVVLGVVHDDGKGVLGSSGLHLVAGLLQVGSLPAVLII